VTRSAGETISSLEMASPYGQNVDFHTVTRLQRTPQYVMPCMRTLLNVSRPVRQDERELRQLVDFVPHVIALSTRRCPCQPRKGWEYLGLTLEEVVKSQDYRAGMYHRMISRDVPGDTTACISQGTRWRVEARLRRHAANIGGIGSL